MKKTLLLALLLLPVGLSAQVINPSGNCPSYAPSGSVCSQGGQIVWLAPVSYPGTSGPTAGWFDDFLAKSTTNNTNCGNIGSPSGSSSASVDNSVGFNHPGLWSEASGTVSGAGIFCTWSAQRALDGLNSGPWVIEADVQVPVLPGTTAGSYEVGVSNVITSLPWATASTPAAFYLSNANGVANDWYCVGTATAVDSGVAATTSYTRLSMLNDGTTLSFWINGVHATACDKAASGLYSGNTYLPSLDITAGSTTSMTINADYLSFWAAPTR